MNIYEDDANHDGHRERLTDLVTQVGIENVSNIQAVEFFLTYIFPRGDVNPLAHRLINEYDDFANIVDAPVHDLMKIKGINKRSASKISNFVPFMDYYASCKMSKKVNLSNNGEFLDMLEQLLRFKKTENLILFACDHSFNFIQKRTLDLKEVRSVGLKPLDLYNFISSTKLAYLLVAHNHPGGTAIASEDDHNAAEYIMTLMQGLESKFLDSIIVGKDGIYSERQESFMRRFADNDSLIDYNDQA